MPNVPDTTLDKLDKFCDSLSKKNAHGIGNECTHFIYAGLFEVDAMDGALDFNLENTITNPLVQTFRIPYSWGREIDVSDTKPGCIVQFQDVVQSIYLYSKGQPWLKRIQKRGHHTGIMKSGALQGSFRQYEANIDEKGYRLMQVRENKIFYETYAIMLTKKDLQDNSELVSDIKKYENNTALLLDMVNWGALRSKFSLKQPLTPNETEKAFLSGSSPKLDASVFFQVHVTGTIKFYISQISGRRKLITNKESRDLEKERVINMMKKSGRAGVNNFKWDWQSLY